MCFIQGLQEKMFKKLYQLGANYVRTELVPYKEIYPESTEDEYLVKRLVHATQTSNISSPIISLSANLNTIIYIRYTWFIQMVYDITSAKWL